MSNRLYIKDGMEFEGISMQEGKASSMIKLIGFIVVTAILLGLLIIVAGNFLSSGSKTANNNTPGITILPTSSRAETPTSMPASPTVALSLSMTPAPSKKLTPTQAKSITPTSGAVSVAEKDVTIEVLNGSGEKGVAKEMATTLTDAGYTVARTGNADVYSYKGVTVTIKKSKANFLTDLKKDIVAGDYIVSSSAATLAESSTVDAVVIVGAK
jgi:hypothetical protein